MVDRQEFVRAYTQVLTKAWTDPSYRAQVNSDPKQALEEVGLDTGGATVQVVDTTQGAGDLDEQVRLFEQGVESGQVKLYVPDSPPADAEELKGVRLDAEAASDDVTVCCCCCPCCTCT
jgi:hypothetical protein